MGSYKLKSLAEVMIVARQEGIGSCVVEVEDATDMNGIKHVVMSQARNVIGKYFNKEQLDRFLQLVDVKLKPFLEIDTLNQGKITVYKPSKEFQIVFIHHVDNLPKVDTMHKLRGVIEHKGDESIVDMYINVQRDLVTIYPPIYFKTNQGFNKRIEGVSEFLESNGSLNIIK
ncbi:hypothetical protein ACQUY5_16730 [Bacillus cereus]|uniref:hypothetical protein n=1 Tax=Bacillus cereus TaxID=1396 RepID=UPI003D172592